jgi:hypothetical protein
MVTDSASVQRMHFDVGKVRHISTLTRTATSDDRDLLILPLDPPARSTVPERRIRVHSRSAGQICLPVQDYVMYSIYLNPRPC